MFSAGLTVIQSEKLVFINCRLHLGNKCDLEDERQVQFEEACSLAKDRSILAALETSAKVTEEVNTTKV